MNNRVIALPELPLSMGYRDINFLPVACQAFLVY